MSTEPRIRLTAELYAPFTRLHTGDKDTQLMLDWTFDWHTIEELYVGSPPPAGPSDPNFWQWEQRKRRADAMAHSIAENLAYEIIRAIPRLVGHG